MAKVMLSTIDNPYSPFDEFDKWNAWDVKAGYQTISFLGRLSTTSVESSDADIELANEQMIDEIVAENVLGVYIKVTQDH
jgi:hypothetical protein